MGCLSYTTAGESHGPCLLARIEGLPAGFRVPGELIDEMLSRRQRGYGRSERQQLETDQAEILAGVLRGETIGSPLVLQIRNRDHRIDTAPPLHRPRPGHADLAGALKWLTDDCRPVLERASARETAARTAAGALAKGLLAEFGIRVVGFVVEIGGIQTSVPEDLPLEQLVQRRDASAVYCPDEAVEQSMKEAIDEAREAGDTVGGVFEVRATRLPPGLGSCAQVEERLDSRLAAAVMGIQAVKGVEIGLGFAAAARRGSQVHDEIFYDETVRREATRGLRRESNRAGGLEGGMTNGEPLIIRGAKKPVSTLARPLRTVDLRTKEPAESAYERSDVCAVPAASVIAEAVVAFELARAFLARFGGDTLTETRERFAAQMRR